MSTTLSSWVGATIANPINPTAQKATSAVASPPPVIYKPFPGLEHLYEVSSVGAVRELVSHKPVKTRFIFGTVEILSAGRHINGKRCNPAIRTAVAKAFVPNPNGYTVLKPVDASRPLTHADNLQWVEKQTPACKPRAVKTAFVPAYQEPAVVPPTPLYSEYLLDRLLSEGRISRPERFRAGVITTPDDSMMPQLPKGVRFITATVEPARYQTLVGKVVQVVVKAERFAFYLGRVVQITPNFVRVSRDNNQWSDRIEPRSVIASIARVVSVLETRVN